MCIRIRTRLIRSGCHCYFCRQLGGICPPLHKKTTHSEACRIGRTVTLAEASVTQSQHSTSRRYTWYTWYQIVLYDCRRYLVGRSFVHTVSPSSDPLVGRPRRVYSAHCCPVSQGCDLSGMGGGALTIGSSTVPTSCSHSWPHLYTGAYYD